MIDIERILQWHSWWKQYIKDDNKKSFPLQPKKEEPIHVLMNGPSRADTIGFIKVKPGKIMMVNEALAAVEEIFPDYYCLADGGYRVVENEYVEGCKKESKAIHEALEKYERPLVLFTPNYLRDNLSISNPNILIQGICCSFCPEYLGGGIVKSLMQKNMGCPRPQGVIVLALYASIQMGYKTIYLHGADQSELLGISVNAQNKMVYKPNHYYEEIGGEKVLSGTMLEEYEAYMYLYKSLYSIEKYAQDCESKIINMFNESRIDCFEKIGDRYL